MKLRFFLSLSLAVVAGCASAKPGQTTQPPAPAPAGKVAQQIDAIRGYATVTSVERTTLADGQEGWLVNYLPKDRAWGQQPEPKWIKLREGTGYVAEMSPEFY